MELNEIIGYILGGGILIAIFYPIFNAKNDKTGILSEDTFDYLKGWKQNELEKKPAADVVDSLDNSDDISKVKSESDKQFDNILDKHRKTVE